MDNDFICMDDVFSDLEFLLVPPTQLHIDRRYQRKERPKMVKKIMDEFDPTVFGAISAARRGKKMFILDGQQRTTAAVKLRLSLVPVVIWQTEGLRDEAKKFYRINHDRQGVTPFEMYHAALAAKEEWAVDVYNLVNNLGLRVNGVRGPGKITCVSTLKRIHGVHGRAGLSEVLDIVQRSWAAVLKESAFEMTAILGVAWAILGEDRGVSSKPGIPLIKREGFSAQRLVRQLSKTTPQAITSRLLSRHGDINQRIKTRMFAREIKKFYNKRG